MRIGVIGWYGHGNAGDERILHSLRSLFQRHDLVAARSFHDAWARLEELNRCDLVLLGGGGLVLRGFGVYAGLIEAIRPRFGCVGISVEAVSKDNLALIRALEQKSEFILVRDTQSRAAFGPTAKVMVGPDLTFLTPFDIAPPRSDISCAINLRDWHYWKADPGSAAHKVMKLLDRTLPVAQKLYPFGKWSPQEASRVVREYFRAVNPVCFYAEPGCLSDADVMRPFFPNADPEFDPAALASSQYLVGMRLHAIIFACQMGIPFVSLSYQPKNLAFCYDAGIGSLSVDIHRLDKLGSALTALEQDYASLRERLIEHRNVSHRTIWSLMKDLFGSVL